MSLCASPPSPCSKELSLRVTNEWNDVHNDEPVPCALCPVFLQRAAALWRMQLASAADGGMATLQLDPTLGGAETALQVGGAELMARVGFRWCSQRV